MAPWWDKPEPKRSYTFPSKAAALAFKSQLGRGGRARISGDARLRKTPTSRICGKCCYPAPAVYDAAYNVELYPWSFADLAELAKLAAVNGSIPAPFADWG